MIQLSIDNSTSRISGVSDAQYKELKEALSYTIDPQAVYFSGSFRTKRSLLGRKGEFPTGLLYIVEEWLLKSQQNHAIHDLRKLPEARHGLFNAKFE